MVSNYSGTLLYHGTGTVCFQTREFFQLTFHLVQYKVFHDVAVKVQLVRNCTSNLGQTKAQKVVWVFFLPTHVACFRGSPTGLLPLSLMNSTLLGRAEAHITNRKAEEV